MLLVHQIAPWHWALAGLAIAAITLALQLLANKSLGVSTGFESLCALVSRRPYFLRRELAGPGRWRLLFLGGLLLGGLASTLLSRGAAPSWDLGLLDQRLPLSPAGKLAWMFGGGLLVGVGTRIAGGCTSGHGIFGMSNLELPSIISTVSFMAAGAVTTNLIYRVIL